MSVPAHLQRIVDQVVDVKRSGRGWVGLCPYHDDSRPSLGITISENERRANLRCFAGCDSDDVRRALGLAVADLYPDSTRNGVKILRRHPYVDELGEVLYEVRVLDRSTDRYRIYHPTVTGWAPKRGDALAVLYRLPDIIRTESLRDTVFVCGPVFVCEGERDADAMAADGFVATTVASGTWRNVDTSQLRGRPVYIVVDNDRGGWNRGLAARDAVAKAGGLFEGAMRPPDDCKDVAEMVEKGYCLTTDLVPVDLDVDQPLVENWHRLNGQPIDRNAFHTNGRAVEVRTPSGLLIGHLQAERLKPDDLAVLMLLEDRAGKSSLAKMNVADIARVLGWRWHRADNSVKRLEAIGLIRKIKRGHWHVCNPCWPGREPEQLDRNATYRNRPEPVPPSSPSIPNKSPVARRPASIGPSERVETPSAIVEPTFGAVVAS